MRDFRKFSAPTAIAVVGILTIGTGTAVAGHQITGKDIKNRSITTVDLSKATIKGLRGKRGEPGKRGLPGSPGGAWYGGHISELNENVGDAFAPPTGFYDKPESSSTAFVDEVGPEAATTLVRIVVTIQDAPGAGSERKFALSINGSLSPACTISDNDLTCNASMSVPIPADADLVMYSTVSGTTAGGADAAFGWDTEG